VKGKQATQEDFSKAFFDALPPPSSDEPSSSMTWTQTSRSITFKISLEATSPHVLVRKIAKSIRILVRVRKKVHIFNFEPEGDVKWPCECTVINGKIEIRFSKADEKCWKSFGQASGDHGCTSTDNNDFDEYFPAQILAIDQVTPNTKTFSVRFEDDVAFWIPIGHDMRVKDVVSGIETSRRYTPCWVPSTTNFAKDYYYFLIKFYATGGLTPCIFEKTCGDRMTIGGVGGDFEVAQLKDIKELYLIAAGTGITPLTRLIYWGLNSLNIM